ncbi:MAG: bacillithiol system redox-active protein YtxJ [Acidobacteriota bacterium]|nr:bacillithiol system redox-active protein YtxJ [Acidobacteriota bacterium]
MPEIRRISTLEELDEVLERSHERPVWILKHSLACPVSSEALREYRGFAEAESRESVEFALIEIQNARSVSQALAQRLGVRHESPQAILVGSERPLWHASHWQISSAALASSSAEVLQEPAT